MNRVNGSARAGGPLVVIGDALLDVDVTGRSDRDCPDAPAPVFDVAAEHERPGGAALAAVLASAERAGREVVLVCGIGEDEAGRRLAGLLGGRVRVLPLPLTGGTPVKARMLAGDRTVVRVDRGDGRVAAGPLSPRVSVAVQGAAAILVSDYGRGAAAHPALRSLLCRRPAGVPLVWDPHPRGAEPVPGADLVTPNAAEAAVFAGAAEEPEPGRAGAVAARLAERWSAGAVAVTLGPHGAALAGDGLPPRLLAAEAADAADSCGAGDRFAAAAASRLAEGRPVPDAVRAAVDAAGRFVAEGAASAVAAPRRPAPAPAASGPSDIGALRARTDALRAHGGRVIATGGCFDVLHAGHVSLLTRARELGDYLIVCVNDDASVTRLKGAGRPILPVADRVRVLTALECVDAVAVFGEDTPAALLDRLRPDVWVKGGDYRPGQLAEAATVRRYGGEIALIPLLAGRSTTRMVTAIRATAP
ncbi:D-glycero-beta-D-manno-heptose 1-phosphate adenylyltransferase [Allonocardiopsis opalescens]|uniref:D-glycero-beta-D-manno-heptose 1-phosphate adenylyltransferase n=1 Tax=Allonocardiopsis opalescens TaxID=1144618 RepID=A0A2T0PXB1_9ACTN|nr:D-glycero-beta-D-manno-heptose 1-phosphate adenylyltransferase [Allonocardiopsis opalescens]PRX96177.1 rfaE bifunctional protein kinase chain/domain/rfaE bifunctional protein nucleotidyltransferase chain/domain [Allonocardiopsis opalescens]